MSALGGGRSSWRGALALPLLLLVAPLRAETRVVSVGFTVSNLEKEVDFFTRVLDFRREGGVVEQQGDVYEHLVGVFGARSRTQRVCLVAECLDLTEFLAPVGRAIPADSRSNDRWFQHVAIVVSGMESAYARLRAAGVEHVSTAPQRLPDWNPNAGGIVAFYFRDPDGHNLELIWYPSGKGDPRWQSKDRLFLGVDHTAIGVGSSAAGLAFWRDALGFVVAGGAENWGVEQEHLNQVFGARLSITGLRSAGGIGVEFLEYLAPSGGRGPLVDLAANDLAHWQVRLEVDDVERVAAAARRAGGRWVSAGAIELDTAPAGSRRGALVRDLDGHAVLLTQR